MHINVVIDQLEGLISYFKIYRKIRFASVMISSKEIATIFTPKGVTLFSLF